MISREELNNAKEKRKTSLYHEEKEYLQYVFLNAISSIDGFVFKGGTCLRICFGHERASEDLDFSTNVPVKEIKGILQRCLKNFEALNIKHGVYSEKEFEGNIRFEIRFEGPLFNGNPQSSNTLKLDFNKRKVKNVIAKVIPKMFSDVPLFTLMCLSEEEILAEKIRTMANRQEPRDMYDVWMLLSKGVEIDKALLAFKLKEEGSRLVGLKFPSREEYERDLKALVLHVPPYEQVKKELLERIRAAGYSKM